MTESIDVRTLQEQADDRAVRLGAVRLRRGMDPVQVLKLIENHVMHTPLTKE